ncbi:hypothetical protein H0H87_001524 [Tephrocybe sp. NHM501043]|nr:hypothetical protein H0H87_001524 [Tephrocybe sp. NHM501043]
MFRRASPRMLDSMLSNIDKSPSPGDIQPIDFVVLSRNLTAQTWMSPMMLTTGAEESVNEKEAKEEERG